MEYRMLDRPTAHWFGHMFITCVSYQPLTKFAYITTGYYG